MKNNKIIFSNYIIMVEVSGNKVVGGKIYHPEIEGRLVHEHQLERLPPGATRMETRALNFSSPAFSSSNDLDIPNMDIVPHLMILELQLPALSTDTPVYGPLPCSFEVIEARYKQKAFYTAQESELLMSCVLDDRPQGWTERQLSQGFHQTDATARRLYLPLWGASNIWKQLGPLSSYPSNEFSVSARTRASGQFYTNSSGGGTTGSAIDSMRLLIFGSYATPEEVIGTRQALLSDGVQAHFLRSQHQRATYADNNGSALSTEYSFPAVNGVLGHIRIILRDKDNWETAQQSNVAYFAPEGVSDFISIGKSSNPTEQFGITLPIRYVKSWFHGDTLMNAGAYLSAVTDSDYTDTGIIAVNFYEHDSDYFLGTSSGGYLVANDLRVTLNITSDSEAVQYVDFVFGIQSVAIATAGEINIFNSS